MANNKIKADTRISRKPNHLASRIDNELVVLNVNKGEYSGLDEIGATIWNLLESPQIFSNLVQNLIEIYNVDQQQCTADVVDFLKVLEKAELVKIENEIK